MILMGLFQLSNVFLYQQCLVAAWDEKHAENRRDHCMSGFKPGQVQLYTCNHGICCQSGMGLGWKLPWGPSPPPSVLEQAQLWTTQIHSLQYQFCQAGAHRGQIVLRLHQWSKYNHGFFCTCEFILCVALSQKLGHP